MFSLARARLEKAVLFPHQSSTYALYATPLTNSAETAYLTPWPSSCCRTCSAELTPVSTVAMSMSVESSLANDQRMLQTSSSWS